VAFEELKRRQSAAWSAAPFEHLEPEIAVMHDHLVGRLAVVLMRRLAECALDSRPLGLQQLACAVGIHDRSLRLRGRRLAGCLGFRYSL